VYLEERLRDLVPPLFPSLPRGVSPFFYPLVVEDSKATVTQLLARGIEAVEFWRGPHPACDMTDFPEVAWLRRSVVEIPCHQDIPLSTLRQVVQAVREVLTARTAGARAATWPAAVTVPLES
jgi:hypothetical protein